MMNEFVMGRMTYDKCCGGDYWREEGMEMG